VSHAGARRRIVSLVALAIAVAAPYVLWVSGLWRWIYAVTAMVSIYFDVFVGVIQAFQKIGRPLS
jgi:hypothetical protein